MRLFFLASTALLFLPILNAQVVTPTSCVYHEGDDPAWSRVDYDDSQWQTQAPPIRDFKLSEVPTTRAFWMRCRISLPNSAAPIYLQLRSHHAWTAFLDGTKVGAEGDPESGAVTNPMPSLPLPASTISAIGSHLVAIRLSRGSRDQAVTSANIAFGPSAALRLRRAEAIETSLRSYWFSDLMVPFLLAVGLLFVLLSGADPSRREILLWGILTSGFALVRGLDLIRGLLLPSAVLEIVLNVAVNLTSCVAPWFFYSLRRKNVPLFYKATATVECILVLLFLVVGFPVDAAYRLYALTSLTFVFRSLRMLLFMFLWAAVIPAFWPWWKLRGQDLVIFFAAMVRVAVQWFYLLANFPVIGPRLGIPTSVVRQVQTAGVLPATLVLTVILALRMRRLKTERDDLSSEMKAATEVQQRLVPSRPPVIPGYSIDAAYLPAKEVGGDFYRLIPAPDGSLLVVVGDVSGKGLNAAMIVASVIGALGDLQSRQPADVLSHLNRALHGQTGSGFVTCCAALFHSSGQIEIANAGHVPPYVNGAEVTVDSGLPLGIVPDTIYEPTTIQTNNTLTFLSDGVLEATSKSGELLGFERLAPLTAKPAEAIAQAAQQWGQEDDITVVQVAYA